MHGKMLAILLMCSWVGVMGQEPGEVTFSEKVTSQAGQCEILFPKKPELKQDKSGERYFLTNEQDKTEFMLRWDGGRKLKPSEGEIKEEFESMRKTIPARLQAVLDKEAVTKYSDASYPMLTLYMTQGAKRYEWRIIRARGFQYQLVVADDMLQLDLEKTKQKEVDSFFNSFKLLEPVKEKQLPVKISAQVSKCEIVFPHQPKAKMEKDSERYEWLMGDDLFLLDCNRTQRVVKTEAEFNQYFDELQKRLAKSIGGTVTKVADGKLGEYQCPMRTLSIEMKDEKGATFHYRWRLIYRDGCLYQVVVGGSKEVVDGKEAEGFFQSFKIVETA